MFYIESYSRDGERLSIINSKTLEMTNITIDELFDMNKSGDIIHGVKTDFMYESNQGIDVENPEILSEFEGFVYDKYLRINGRYMPEALLEMEEQGVYLGKSHFYLKRGSKIPVTYRSCRCDDFSMSDDDITIYNNMDYIWIWYNDKIVRIVSNFVKSIFRQYNGEPCIKFDTIAVEQMHGISVYTRLGDYINNEGTHCKRKDFKRRILLE